MAKRKRFPAGRLDLSNVDEAFRARFWSKVNVGHRTSCWPWARYCKPEGYGQFTLSKGVFTTSSRVAYALARGPIEELMYICHRCDNPPCCNPAHLFLGTQTDNTNDSVSKGRANRSHGEDHRDHKLTAEDVRAIRATPIVYGTRALLARQYGVNLHSIDKVLNGTSWKSVA